MAAYSTIDALLPLAGKRVLLRGDLNVPMADGVVSDATRLERLAPTITELALAGARIIVLSHLGRPKGKWDPALSLKALVTPLSEALGGRTVAFVTDCIGTDAVAAVAALADGDVLLLENLRFHGGEEANDPAFIKALAALGDAYVNDAFSAAHRAHGSTEGLAYVLPAAAGRLMQAELKALDTALGNPRHPVAAVVGGAKVSTKLDVLGNLVGKTELLVIGGAMANTFLHALGTSVGISLCEPHMADIARDVLARADAAGCEVVLPTDVVVAAALEEGVDCATVRVSAVPDDRMILDLGAGTTHALAERLADCRTLLWNGPLGAFEISPFDEGTNLVARAVAGLTRQGSLLSVAGGGDTVAVLARAGLVDDFSYVSTAGGAFLEWIEGKTLPGVAALEG